MEHKLWGTWGSVAEGHGLRSCGSRAQASSLWHMAAGRIFPDQGLNPCPLHARWIANHRTTRGVSHGMSRTEPDTPSACNDSSHCYSLLVYC